MPIKDSEIGININIGSDLDAEFLELMSNIPNELKKIQGISELDPFVLSRKFFNSSTVAEASIDPNANLAGKTPVSYQSEIFKPQLKYASYYDIWCKVKELYGLDAANDCIKSCINGSLYFHDITKTNCPYCFAFDTSFLMTEGRPYGWLPSVPPKRSNSFMSQLVETTMDMSQEHAGAIGIANILVNLAYYTRKERKALHDRVEYIFDTYPDVSTSDMTRDDLIEMSVTDAIVTYIAGLGLDNDVIEDYIGCGISGCEWTKQKAFDMADAVYNKYVENLMQNFVHIMHNTFRIGGDSPFTNISLFDSETYKTVFADPLYPDMTPVVENYDEVNTLQKIFVEFFHKGNPHTGKVYRFPVVTANIKTNSEGKIEDKEFFTYISKANMVRSAFNLHIGEKVATCCRLTSDLSSLKENVRMDSFGNGGLSIGSHRVVTINLHRMALIAKYGDPDTGFIYNDIAEVLDTYLLKAEKLLVAHRQLLKEKVEQGFLKFFAIGWESLDMLFSTIGYTGLIDAFAVESDKTIDDIVKDDALLDKYVEFAGNTIDQMESFTSVAGQRNERTAWNVEEIPAENASPKLAQSDNFIFGAFDDVGYQPVDLLSNQMIPLYTEVPLMKRIEISGKLMNKVSGGSIIHINITERVTEGAYMELYRSMVEDYKIPHFAINLGSTTCENGHVCTGIHKDECPECGGKPVDWTLRVVGFNTDVSSWSPERQAEFKKRQIYTAQNVLDRK